MHCSSYFLEFLDPNRLNDHFYSTIFDVYNRHEEVHAVVQKWLQGLPSVLLLLKDANPSMTELVLRDMKKAMVQCVPQPDHNFLAHLSLFFCGFSDL